MAANTTYLERYLAGEYEQVWDELVALGEQARDEPLYSSVLAVARETMQRVRHNIALVIPRLRDSGYVFGHAWAVPRGALTAQEVAEFDREYPLLDPPTDDTPHQIAELERRAGPLPLSLRAFYEIVGGVNLIGAHPVWDASRLDPLEVESARAVLHHDDFDHFTDDRHEDGTCELPIAPDEYFKYLYSGGGPYAVAVRDVVADAPLRYEWHHTTFVNYLRVSLRWAGLPGLERVAMMREAELTALTTDLLPI